MSLSATISAYCFCVIMCECTRLRRSHAPHLPRPPALPIRWGLSLQVLNSFVVGDFTGSACLFYDGTLVCSQVEESDILKWILNLVQKTRRYLSIRDLEASLTLNAEKHSSAQWEGSMWSARSCSSMDLRQHLQEAEEEPKVAMAHGLGSVTNSHGKSPGLLWCGRGCGYVHVHVHVHVDVDVMSGVGFRGPASEFRSGAGCAGAAGWAAAPGLPPSSQPGGRAAALVPVPVSRRCRRHGTRRRCIPTSPRAFGRPLPGHAASAQGPPSGAPPKCGGGPGALQLSLGARHLHEGGPALSPGPLARFVGSPPGPVDGRSPR